MVVIIVLCLCDAKSIARDSSLWELYYLQVSEEVHVSDKKKVFENVRRVFNLKAELLIFLACKNIISFIAQKTTEWPQYEISTTQGQLTPVTILM